MYTPFSLSTRRTTTTSFRPTRMSFWIDRIRRLESSESRIMPSMLSYSSYLHKTDERVRIHCRERKTYEFDIGTHLGDLAHLHHDELVDLRIALLVVTHVGCRRCGVPSVMSGKEKSRDGGIDSAAGA